MIMTKERFDFVLGLHCKESIVEKCNDMVYSLINNSGFKIEKLNLSVPRHRGDLFCVAELKTESNKLEIRCKFDNDKFTVRLEIEYLDWKYVDIMEDIRKEIAVELELYNNRCSSKIEEPEEAVAKPKRIPLNGRKRSDVVSNPTTRKFLIDGLDIEDTWEEEAIHNLNTL